MFMSDDPYDDELCRRAGASPPVVFVCVLLAGIALAIAISVYLYAADFERAGGHPVVVHSRAGVVDMRKNLIGDVAEWGVPRIGKWGCAAIFATPGVAFTAVAAWLLWRGRRRTAPGADVVA
jgi:hypothetical protein